MTHNPNGANVPEILPVICNFFLTVLPTERVKKKTIENIDKRVTINIHIYANHTLHT